VSAAFTSTVQPSPEDVRREIIDALRPVVLGLAPFGEDGAELSLYCEHNEVLDLHGEELSTEGVRLVMSLVPVAAQAYRYLEKLRGELVKSYDDLDGAIEATKLATAVLHAYGSLEGYAPPVPALWTIQAVFWPARDLYLKCVQTEAAYPLLSLDAATPPEGE
jgi:hypothetical protein